MRSPLDILASCDECAAVPTPTQHINAFSEYSPEYTITHRLCDDCLSELVTANKCGDCGLPKIEWLPNNCQCSNN